MTEEIRDKENEITLKNLKILDHEKVINNYKTKITGLKEKVLSLEKSNVELNLKINYLNKLETENWSLKEEIQ
jgi:hypothetical protein